MSPAEIILLVTRVLIMLMLTGQTEEEPREYEVVMVKPVGQEQVYDVIAPRGYSYSTMGDSTVVLAGNQ